MRLLIIILLSATLVSCQQNVRQDKTGRELILSSTGNFGDEINPDNAIDASEIPSAFNNSDTINIKISGKILASCKHSGCWMDIDMGDGDALHVTFLEESFTIPLDAAGKFAISEGMAVRNMISVETLQNYAREDGKSEEEITAITEPSYAYKFIAKGVLIEEFEEF